MSTSTDAILTLTQEMALFTASAAHIATLPFSSFRKEQDEIEAKRENHYSSLSQVISSIAADARSTKPTPQP